MQISDMGVAYIMLVLALVLAMLSLVVPDYLYMRTGRITSRKTRLFLWMVFAIIASSLLISSSILMIGSGHYPEIITIILICILLGLSGFLDLSKLPVPQNPIVSE